MFSTTLWDVPVNSFWAVRYSLYTLGIRNNYTYIYVYTGDQLHVQVFNSKVFTLFPPLSQATVLEEMPTFPDRESSLLSKLYQSAPWTAKLHKTSGEESVGGATHEESSPPPISDIGQAVGESLVSTTGEW